MWFVNYQFFERYIGVEPISFTLPGDVFPIKLISQVHSLKSDTYVPLRLTSLQMGKRHIYDTSTSLASNEPSRRLPMQYLA